jgi:predicted transcriptional regulator
VQEILMQDGSQPPRGKSAGRPARQTELEKALNEGIDDLDAGRTVSREESRRELEAVLGSYEKKKAPAR